MTAIALAQTEALRRALGAVSDQASIADLLFIEAFELNGIEGVGAALRATQIKRANPTLIEEIRAEIADRRRA